MSDREIEATQLQPYKSLVLAKIESGATLKTLFDDCLSDIATLLDLKDDAEDSGERERVEVHRDPHSKSAQENLVHGFLHYRLLKPVSWAAPDDLRDKENHLVLLTRKRKTKFLTLYASENSRRRAIRRKFGASGIGTLQYDFEGLNYLSPLSPDLLNDAFFGDQVRTLWLSGMHRRVPVKADAKVLSGQDLEYALDPVNDQTFYFTAARGSIDQSGPDEEKEELRTVGLSPKKSRIWTRRSSDWADYRQGVNQILGHLDETSDQDSEGDSQENGPLPILADTPAELDSTDIGNPYDMVIQPPELLSADAEEQKEEREKAEEWAYNAHFDISNDSGKPDPPNVEADLYHRGDKIGNVEINIDADDPTDVEIEEVETNAAEDNDDNEKQDELLDEIKRLCGRARNLKVYYDNAYTLSDGAIYRVRYRDQEFENFKFGDFSSRDDGTSYSRTVEKPYRKNENSDSRNVAWAQIGKDDSLFCWVVNHWPDHDRSGEGANGWLICDDGSGEIADFIHLEEPKDDDSKPTLTLIHVKAAGSENGQIAVGEYDKVTSQAVKNLRDLDASHLSTDLSTELPGKLKELNWKGEKDLVWKDGEQQDSRDGLIKQIKDLGTNYKRRVVVVQPHIRKSYLCDKRGEDDPPKSLRQLDTILNQAEQACQGIGAKFQVVLSDE